MATAPAAPRFRVPWHITLRLGVTGTIFSLNDAGAGGAGNALRCRVARPEHLSKRLHCWGYTLPLAVARCSYNGWTWVNNTMALNLSRGRLAASLCETLGAWRLCKSCSQSLTSRDVSASRWNVREKFTFYNVSAEKWVSSLQLILYPTLPHDFCSCALEIIEHAKCTPNSRLWLAYSETFYFSSCLCCEPLPRARCGANMRSCPAVAGGCQTCMLGATSADKLAGSKGRGFGAVRGRGGTRPQASRICSASVEDLMKPQETSDPMCHRKKSPSQTNCFSRTVGNVWKYDMRTI